MRPLSNSDTSPILSPCIMTFAVARALGPERAVVRRVRFLFVLVAKRYPFFA